MRGMIGVTNPAVVQWSQEVCCGAGCGVQTTTTTTSLATAVATTTSSATSTTTTASTLTPTTRPSGPCPNATDDFFTIVINSILVNSVVTNDIGCNGAIPPTVGSTVTTLVSGPTSGVLSLLPSGSFTFTPVFNSLSNVSFVYRLCDVVSPSSCSMATVLINIISGGSAPIARDDRFQVNSSTGFSLTGTVIANDTSSSFNPAGPNQTPIPGNFFVSAPRFCTFAPSTLPLNPCGTATLSVTPLTGQFAFSLPNPSASCPGNYSAVERCLETGTLSQCRPACSISYGYLLTETAGPELSSSATLSFDIVPPVAHVVVSVTSLRGPGPFVTGQNNTFAVRLFNAGPESATNVLVRIGVASGLPVQNTSSGLALPLWTVPSLPVGASTEVLISTGIQDSPFPHVVTALVMSLAEFDYSVAGHFALARITVVPPVAPIAPNQTFASTNASCATLNVLGAVRGADLDLSSFAVIVDASTQGSVQVLPDRSVKFVPTEGYLGTTCFVYRICNVYRLCSEAKVFVQVLPSSQSQLQVNFFFGRTGV